MIQEFKIDLHTHSSISHDGGISIEQYQLLLAKDPCLYLAITDHNEVSYALEARQKLGDKIIVGEEIKTQDGELIGLYLTRRIEPRLSLEATIREIKKQNGLVYVPHPLERTRKGLSMIKLKDIAGAIDILEGYNGRSKEPWSRKKVMAWAAENNLTVTASSDAHGVRGVGRAYTTIFAKPTRQTLVKLVQEGHLVKRSAAILSYLDPMKNKLRRRFK